MVYLLSVIYTYRPSLYQIYPNVGFSLPDSRRNTQERTGPGLNRKPKPSKTVGSTQAWAARSHIRSSHAEIETIRNGRTTSVCFRDHQMPCTPGIRLRLRWPRKQDETLGLLEPKPFVPTSGVLTESWTGHQSCDQERVYTSVCIIQ